MKTPSALLTTANSLANACEALKPAIGDLAHSHEDFYFESMMKLYLSMKTQERRISRFASNMESV